MGEAITQLRVEGHDISPAEAEAARACILLHDIGHGPFSHALEHSLVSDVHHEQISLWMMRRINEEMMGKLDLALEIFTNKYHKQFLHQLVSGQLDMDRLDYLSRDSFYTGVIEGTVAAARLIKMLNVVDDKLVVEAKGIYSVEKFLVARRLMYWQVYLHKTSVGAEKLLVNILKRAKELAGRGEVLFASPALQYFLYNNVRMQDFIESETPLKNFALLDDSDLVCAIKVWASHKDVILSSLCRAFTDRKLFKVEINTVPVDAERYEAMLALYMKHFEISRHEAIYFLGEEVISTDTYNAADDNINILYKNGDVKDVAEASDMLNITVLTKKVSKHYFCYYRI